MIRYIFPEILFTGFVLAIFFAVIILKQKEWKYPENRLFLIFCLSSAVWSFGFFGVLIQTIPDKAYTWRAIGMVGTFAYLISATYLVCHFANSQKFYRYFAEGFSLLGIPIYFFVIQKEQTIYKLDKIGMTYSFKPGLWNNLYIMYSVIVAINMLFVVVHMLRSAKSQRFKELAKKLLLVEGVVIFGMILDTIFPLIGKMAIPGSSIAQFLGLAVMYHTIIFVSHSRINISNMSEFIYYSLNVPVIIYDSDLKLQILNDTAYSFFGITKEDLSNTEVEQLFTIKPEDVFHFDNDEHTVDAICCNNMLYCNLSVNKIYDDYDDVLGYIIIVTDLSERIKSMKELEEAMNEAEHANKAKSSFLANMSHEIRTPMNAIIGFSELVLKMDINDEVREHVEDIKWSSHNLLAIINDILDISKIESGKMELTMDNYYTASLLNDVALIISSQANKKDLEFKMNVAENIPREMYGDKVRIRGILINILNNAVKYTNEGQIIFDVSVINQTTHNIKLEFKITDTGIGIKPENLDNLFNTFERLDQKHQYAIEGSGLGLSIANGFINLMGGDIFVESTYGKGSTFTVILEQGVIDATPLDKEFYRSKDNYNNSSLSEMQIRDLHVLVTDDNTINLKVAHGILSYYGLNVDTAGSGKEAIELCKNNNYDIIFMDQMMPEIDGIEAMKQIRKLNSHYKLGSNGKIIVLTADAIKGARESLLEKGFDEYLGKPINVTQLERIFQEFVPKEKIIYKKLNSLANKQNNDITYLKENLTDINIENGIANCGGQVLDYLKILQITYEYGEKQLEELKNAYDNKDYEYYTIKIHALKSTSLNIGATEISEMAKAQELEGKAENYSYIDKHMKEFQDEYRKLLEKLYIVLSHFDMLPNTDTSDDAIELVEETIIQILNNIDRCIDDFDFSEVFEILEETKNYKLPEKYRELFDKIANLMEDLSVDEIKELIHNALD